MEHLVHYIHLKMNLFKILPTYDSRNTFEIDLDSHRIIYLCRRRSHQESGGGQTSPCPDRSARSDRSKRARDAGWYRPFGFADSQLRGPRRFDIDDKYRRFRLAATGLRGF